MRFAGSFSDILNNRFSDNINYRSSCSSDIPVIFNSTIPQTDANLLPNVSEHFMEKDLNDVKASIKGCVNELSAISKSCCEDIDAIISIRDQLMLQAKGNVIRDVSLSSEQDIEDNAKANSYEKVKALLAISECNKELQAKADVFQSRMVDVAFRLNKLYHICTVDGEVSGIGEEFDLSNDYVAAVQQLGRINSILLYSKLGSIGARLKRNYNGREYSIDNPYHSVINSNLEKIANVVPDDVLSSTECKELELYTEEKIKEEIGEEEWNNLPKNEKRIRIGENLGKYARAITDSKQILKGREAHEKVIGEYDDFRDDLQYSYSNPFSESDVPNGSFAADYACKKIKNEIKSMYGFIFQQPTAKLKQMQELCDQFIKVTQDTSPKMENFRARIKSFVDACGWYNTAITELREKVRKYGDANKGRVSGYIQDIVSQMRNGFYVKNPDRFIKDFEIVKQGLARYGILERGGKDDVEVDPDPRTNQLLSYAK